MCHDNYGLMQSYSFGTGAAAPAAANGAAHRASVARAPPLPSSSPNGRAGADGGGDAGI